MDRNSKAGTGIAGLDDIAGGGFSRGRIFLLEGEPGSGKTTIANQFMLNGAENGEECLYITLSETEQELREGAASHGWRLPPSFHVFELVPAENLLDDDQRQSLLYSSDLELGETIERIFERFEALRPDRVVLDSLSEIRLLAHSSLRYRRQLLGLKHYFARHDTTVLMIDDRTSENSEKTVHSLVHGVLMLEQRSPDYRADRRRLRLTKYRGQKFRGGYHDFVIETGGVRVFPRLASLEHKTDFQRGAVSTGNGQLDLLLGGGFDKGSSALILGPAGTGKSLFVLFFVEAVIKQGGKAAMFVFDEELGTLVERAEALAIDVKGMVDTGHLTIEQVDAAELSPGEFSHRVRHCVEQLDIKTVVIDSLNGFQAAMPDETSLILHMHELLQYLGRHGATTIVTVAQHNMAGNAKSPVDVSYIADTVVLLRYFETAGRVGRAISVIKKRTGPHEDTIREFRIGVGGITLSEPLADFHGVLAYVPTIGGSGGLLGLALEDRNA